MSRRFKIILTFLLVVIIALLVFLILKLTGANNNTLVLPTITNTSTFTTVIPAPPHPPSNFTGTPKSTLVIMLSWQDNSSDEDGFIIYRDSVEITKTNRDVTTYNDTGLTASTGYQYTIKAFNQDGDSSPVACSVKTLNPPLIIRLDKVGVYDNREVVTRGKTGEVYLLVAVTDSGHDPVQLRFPSAEGQYYKLEKNTVTDVNALIYTAANVGDKVTLTIIGYENDGEGFEALAYKALGKAIEIQAIGAVGSILEIFDVNLSGLIGQLMGEADDWLGSFEKTWDISTRWGAGSYADVVCKDENGVDCLRLWFTVSGD
jgi:hypothetical protein